MVIVNPGSSSVGMASALARVEYATITTTVETKVMKATHFVEVMPFEK